MGLVRDESSLYRPSRDLPAGGRLSGESAADGSPPPACLNGPINQGHADLCRFLKQHELLDVGHAELSCR